MKLVQYILLLIALQVVFVSTGEVSFANKSTVHHQTVKTLGGDGGLSLLGSCESFNAQENEDDSSNLIFTQFIPFYSCKAFTVTVTKRLYQLATPPIVDGCPLYLQTGKLSI